MGNAATPAGKMPFPWKIGIGFAGGLRRSEILTQDPYWLVDLMARYQITKNLSASVNVNNVFDKNYYTNIGFYDSAYPGDPRNFMVTTRYNF